MPEPPPRKRFQIHLSTAIVLTFVAGGLIWANIVEEAKYPNYTIVNMGTRRTYFTQLPYSRNYGWPVVAARIQYEYVFQLPDEPVMTEGVFPTPLKFLEFGILVDVFTGVVILLTAWLVSEWLIRRRTARKDP